MDRWMIYFKERFPLPVYFLLVGGFSVSGALLDGEPIYWPKVLVSFLGILGFFALLRLMDECKDYRTDLVAHPERPLPRGLFNMSEVSRTIRIAAGFMVLYGLFVARYVSWAAGWNYLFLTAYLWLMYREFYVGWWLEGRQLLYALSHQAVLLPLCSFAVLVHNPDSIYFAKTWLFGLLVFGSFFSYEVCRKLDPNALPILRTYRYMYGTTGSFALVAVSTGIAAASAWKLGLQPLLWPASISLILSYFLFVKGRFKIVEGVASLSLTLHIWAVALASLFLKGWIR